MKLQCCVGTPTSASQCDLMMMLPGISVWRMLSPISSVGSAVRIEQSVKIPSSSRSKTSGEPYLHTESFA